MENSFKLSVKPSSFSSVNTVVHAKYICFGMDGTVLDVPPPVYSSKINFIEFVISSVAKLKFRWSSPELKRHLPFNDFMSFWPPVQQEAQSLIRQNPPWHVFSGRVILSFYYILKAIAHCFRSRIQPLSLQRVSANWVGAPLNSEPRLTRLFNNGKSWVAKAITV
jgi:hypothetical protein